MRTPTLQYLYLQKPVTLIVIICLLSVLPWIGMGDFSTKGEPREAAVAISMLESGNWILPQTYADEFAFKPPMAHWLMAICSLPGGAVTEFSSRLPSAVAFVVLMGFVLVFLGRRITRFHEAFIATLLLITSVEIHRAAMTTRVDMLLTTFMVLGLFQLYRWEEKFELKGLPIVIPLLLGCAVLTKGPVGIVLPLFVFTIYLLMLGKYAFPTICKVVFYAGLSSIFLPSLWYIAAWRQGGDAFLDLVLAENFGRFFRLTAEAIPYELGHENGVWYNFATLAAGFAPWTLFFFFSLFGVSKISCPERPFKQFLVGLWQRIRRMEKVRLFSLVAVVCILFFYSIPASKRSVYLMPAYPFISLFLAQYALYITEYRTRCTRFFAAVLTALVTVVLIGCLLVMVGAIDPIRMVSAYTQKESVLYAVQLVADRLAHPDIWTWCIVDVNLLALLTLYYQLFKKINIKMLYATIVLTFTVNFLVDGVVMPAYRKGHSAKAFAEQIRKSYPLTQENLFVVNDLRHFRNLYGLNFYMGNRFRDLDHAQPETGYFVVAEKDMEAIKMRYAGKYAFELLTETAHPLDELHQRIQLYTFRAQ